MTSIIPLIADKAAVYDISQIYDPNNASSTGRYFPAQYSIVLQNNVPFVVTMSDSVNLIYTLEPAEMDTDSDVTASVISYRNDILRAYFDTRSNPYRVMIDASILIYGLSASSYNLVRYPNNQTKSTVISKYYNTAGSYVGTNIPLTALTTDQNTWTCNDCFIDVLLTDDEILALQIFNETGALIGQATLFAKKSTILNDSLSYQSRIKSLTATATQVSQTGQIYIYPQQSITSLDITPILTYSDGTQSTLTIDGNKTILYGTSDFISSYPGLSQNLMLRYFLSSGTEISTTDLTAEYIDYEFSVLVVSSQAMTPMKITVIPTWDVVKNAYVLSYFAYDTAGNGPVNVTQYITYTTTPNGSDFINTQSFSISLDVSNAFPKSYSPSSIYTQNFVIKFQPQAAYVRYTIRDAMSSTIVYGVDSSTQRRPVLYYDSTLSQYFIPSSLFQNTASVLESFFTAATPPYNPNIQSTPTTPTHFIIRDPASGTMLTATNIPIDSYNTALTLLNGANSNYVGSTLMVEFIYQASDSVPGISLYGVPVDVYRGTYA